MFSLSSNARDEIQRQRNELQKRLASGMYLHEGPEFDAATNAYPLVADRLGIAEDLGSLTTSESRNLVRKVQLKNGFPAVLKIIGNTVEPGEFEVLKAWEGANLPAVKALDGGYQRIQTAHGPRSVIYLLTEFVDAPTLSKATEKPEPSTTEEHSAVFRSKVNTVETLTEFMRQFHDPSLTVRRTRTWEDRTRLHTKWTLPILEAHGLPIPERWQEKLAKVSEGNVLLHGDAAGSNILVGEHSLIALDPPGALRGAPEADIGQICSQVGGVEHVEAMVGFATDADHHLDPTIVAAAAGINFMTWAGYALGDHRNPDVVRSEDQEAVAAGKEQALHFLGVAKRLMDELNLDRFIPAAALQPTRSHSFEGMA